MEWKVVPFLLDAADHISSSSFLPSHPTTLSLPLLAACPAQNHRERRLRGSFVSVGSPFLFLFFAGALPKSRCHPSVVDRSFNPTFISFPLQVLLPPPLSLPPWTPTTAYKFQPPEVPQGEPRVRSLSNPHHRPHNPNRRENGRPTPCNLRSNNPTSSRTITCQPTATSTPTLRPLRTLPPTPVAPFPSLARTCCFRHWGRASLVRSSLGCICSGARRSL